MGDEPKRTWPWTWVTRLVLAVERIALVQSASFVEAQKSDLTQQRAAQDILEATSKLNSAMRDHVAECRQWQKDVADEIKRMTSFEQGDDQKKSRLM